MEPLISIGARLRGSSLLAFSAWVHSRFFAGFVLERPHRGFLDVAAGRSFGQQKRRVLLRLREGCLGTLECE